PDIRIAQEFYIVSGSHFYNFLFAPAISEIKTTDVVVLICAVSCLSIILKDEKTESNQVILLPKNLIWFVTERDRL
ncbi:MAG: hypothetical protein D6714_18895, partial [Bacteroidetes bacterium]